MFSLLDTKVLSQYSDSTLSDIDGLAHAAGGQRGDCMFSRGVFVICAFPVLLLAQDPYGRVTGRVVDSTGAVVSAAGIQVTNIETNVVSRGATDSQGNYDVRNLVPGRYRLVVEMQGFKRHERGPMELRVGDVLTIEVGLEVGVVTDSVTITAEAPMLETASASVGQVVDSRRVQDLPSPASSVIYMTQLSAGIIPTTSPTADWAPNGPEVASGLSSNGSDNRSNEFVVDGVPNLKSSCRPPASSTARTRIRST
jgi:hypothetical protein